MTEPIILLDPTSEAAPSERATAPRPMSLDGLTIGLLSISKKTSDVFLDEIETRLKARALTSKRFRKPTFARVAPVEIKQEITSQCDVVIEALAD